MMHRAGNLLARFYECVLFALPMLIVLLGGA